MPWCWEGVEVGACRVPTGKGWGKGGSTILQDGVAFVAVERDRWKASAGAPSVECRGRWVWFMEVARGQWRWGCIVAGTNHRVYSIALYILISVFPPVTTVYSI